MVTVGPPPDVTPGTRFVIEGGEVEIDSIEPITLDDVTDALARSCGFSSDYHMRKMMKGTSEESVHLVRLHFIPAARTIVKRPGPVIPWAKRPRLEPLDDGTIRTRAGTQMNCGGIADIRVRITATAKSGIECVIANDTPAEELDSDIDFPAHEVEPELLEAACKGAAQAWETSGVTQGIRVELLSLWVHPVDARPSKFWQAGAFAVTGWLELNGFLPR